MTKSAEEHAEEYANAVPEAEPRPESLGATFRRVREAQGLEQRDVARRLNLNVSIIQAIDDDRLQGLGAPVFVRMYLQRYAQLLELPDDVILTRYKALGIDAPPPLRFSHSLNGQPKFAARWLTYPLVLGVMAWLGWTGLDWLSAHFELPDAGALIGSPPVEDVDRAALAVRSDQMRSGEVQPLPGGAVELSEPADDLLAEQGVAAALAKPLEARPDQDPRQVESQAGTAAADLVIAAATEVASPESLGESEPRTNSNSEAASSTQQPAGGVQSEAATGAAALASAAATDGATGNEHRLSMFFAEDCWIEVKDGNGQRLARGIIRASDERTWTGSAPFAIKLGHAQAVDIKLNGEVVDKSVYIPKRGTVSRFVLEAPSSG